MTNRLHKLYLSIRAIPKTILFNFYYLLKFDSPIRTNMVRIGFHENPPFDQKRERAVWNNRGTILFKGIAYLGNGTRIANTGTLTFGNNFQVSGNTSIICKHQITFGDDVLIAWRCMFMDGDSHKVYLEDTEQKTDKNLVCGSGGGKQTAQCQSPDYCWKPCLVWR